MPQRAGVLLVAVACVWVYANTLHAPFVFDDERNILANPQIRLQELSLGGLRAAAFESLLDRPVAYATFALNYRLGEYEVWGYHAVNIAIHGLSGLLVLALARLLFARDTRMPARAVPAASLFAALIFVAHPVQTQAVTYVVQRMTSMAGLFYLLAFWLYLLGRDSQVPWKRWSLWAGGLASWTLALGTKENAVMLPAVVFLYEWYFGRGAKLQRNLVYAAAALIALGALVFLYLGENPLHKILADYEKRDFTLEERLLTQVRVVVFYASLLLLPLPSRLNLVHAFPTSRSLVDPITTLLCLLALIGLAAIAVALARRDRLASFCIAWFFVHLVIESTVIALEMVYEHRLYVPMFGFALLVTHLLFAYVSRPWCTAVAVLAVVALGVGAYVRNQTWRDEVALWSDVVAKNPDSHRTRYNLGTSLSRAGRFEEAASHLSKGLRLAPDNAKLHNNLGLALEKRGRLGDAIPHYREALRLQPGYAVAHNNLGAALARQGRLAEALRHFEQALALKPDYESARENLEQARRVRDAANRDRQPGEL